MNVALSSLTSTKVCRSPMSIRPTTSFGSRVVPAMTPTKSPGATCSSWPRLKRSRTMPGSCETGDGSSRLARNGFAGRASANEPSRRGGSAGARFRDPGSYFGYSRVGRGSKSRPPRGSRNSRRGACSSTIGCAAGLSPPSRWSSALAMSVAEWPAPSNWSIRSSCFLYSPFSSVSRSVSTNALVRFCSTSSADGTFSRRMFPFVKRMICCIFQISRPATKVIARPVLPARPVRPMRCT